MEHRRRFALVDKDLPFGCKDILKLLNQHFPSRQSPGDTDSDMLLVATELVQLMKEAFEKICIEVSRLSSHMLKCSANDICTAVKVRFSFFW